MFCREGSRRLAAALAVGLVACAAPAPPQMPIALAPPPGLSVWERLTWFEEQAAHETAPAREAQLRSAMGRLYLLVERPERAEEALRRAAQLRPARRLEPEDSVGLARAVLAQGRSDEARRLLERELNRSREAERRDEIRLLIALAFENAGRSSDARIQRAAIGDPDRPGLASLERSMRGYWRNATSGTPAASPVEVLPRALWRAAPARRFDQIRMGGVTALTVHHEGAKPSLPQSTGEVAEQLRRVQLFHMESRGWADIAYHYLIDASGRVWEGRPSGIQGAHAGNHAANRGNLGICLLGNFEEQRPSTAAVDALGKLMAQLQGSYSIPGTRIFTHNEIRQRYGLAGTACPGRHLAPVVSQLRARPRS